MELNKKVIVRADKAGVFYGTIIRKDGDEVELKKAYALSDIAFIGGSFNKTGGHNPLEATIYDIPTISGPSIKNFRDIYSILTNAKASVVVNNSTELDNILTKLLSDKEYYETMRKNCKTIFNDQQGIFHRPELC